MEQRFLGNSGLRVPVLSMGTATFGGKGDFFGAVGNTGPKEARRLVDICFDHGVSLFDTADVYSDGLAEEVLGHALQGRRDKALICTKCAARVGDGPNDVGASRFHILRSVDAALKRLRTDYIDIFALHGFDGLTPIEETLTTFDALIRGGKIRYVGCSNFSAWQLMKSLGIADRWNLPRYMVNQAYYSLVGRDFEWELMPLGFDQKVATMVWSPLGWGRLTGKVRRDRPLPEGSRLHKTDAPSVPDDYLYRVVDVLDDIAAETGKTLPQVAINWLLSRPTVATVIVGARNHEQLTANFGAVGWALSPDQIARLNEASHRPAPYPIWHQENLAERNPASSWTL